VIAAAGTAKLLPVCREGGFAASPTDAVGTSTAVAVAREGGFAVTAIAAAGIERTTPV
jgi:hypothetical protein